MWRPNWPPLSVFRPAVPRPSNRETRETLPSPLLSGLSRPRYAAPRRAARRFGKQPRHAGGAAGAVSEPRPPAEAGSGGGEAKMAFKMPIHGYETTVRTFPGRYCIRRTIPHSSFRPIRISRISCCRINRHTFIDTNSLVRWDINGDMAWGADQDMWPIHRWARMRREHASRRLELCQPHDAYGWWVIQCRAISSRRQIQTSLCSRM
jgi:hypothetical protein